MMQDALYLILLCHSYAEMVVILQGPPGLPGFPGNPGLPVSSFDPLIFGCSAQRVHSQNTAMFLKTVF